MMAKADSLEALAVLYGTDKVEHGYMKYYDKYLPKSESMKALMEIGCYKGASVKMWKEFFHEAEIHTIDLFEGKALDGAEKITQGAVNALGIIAHKGSQADIDFLYTIKKMFNVIIDDGSHNSDHQLISFKHMFINNLCSGGVYVIEDLHCCKEPYYWSKDITQFDDTMLGVILKYKDKGELTSKFFNQTENRDFKNLIADVKLFDDKIAFITRK
jgi:hypothetical protein